MFDDFDGNNKRANKQNAKYNKWLKQNKNKNIAIVEIGAGKDIPTIRSEDNLLSKKYTNIKLIRINPRDFNVDGDDISIALGGLEGIQEILGINN
jgi:hypothetical protein